MAHFVGLDVSLKKTNICVIDADHKVIKEGKVISDPEAIAMFLYDLKLSIERVGLETGGTSAFLYQGLARARLPVTVICAKTAKDFLRSKLNKNDRNDARGIAKMMATRMYKPIHVKTDQSRDDRVLLSTRRILKTKMIDLELNVRGHIRGYGMQLGPITRPKWEARVRELAHGNPVLEMVFEPLIEARRSLREQLAVLERQVRLRARQDPVCRLLMTCPGVGPVVALTYKSAIDIPERFTSSRAVGAHLGLTPKQYASGEVNVLGRISKQGDVSVRTILTEAALTLLTMGKDSDLKRWGRALAEKRGMQKAASAVARRLAVILHRMWMDGTEFRWTALPPPTEA